MVCELLWLSAILAAPGDAWARYDAAQSHMGTKFEIVVYTSGDELAQEAFQAGFERIAELNLVMSDYVSESELSRLSNSSPTTSPVKVSDDLFVVLAAADALSRRSEGAFDVTVGPLTKLWRRARRRGEFPATDLLQAARAATGFRYLRLDAMNQSVELLVPQMRLDLGGIAKGYAADEALRVMANLGVTRAIVNAGGDVVAGDAPPGEIGWRIGVASLEEDAPPRRFLRLANAAVATSGDLWQYVEIDGVRYSHILDPKTGLGLTTRSSVTIFAPTGIAADSLASAVSVLGPVAGLKLVEETPQTEAMILTHINGGSKEFQSTGFEHRLEATADPAKGAKK
ncbi:MAG: FAD:protein FMN transferase [Planctomycetaceae bacterium]|nr:FAD:protein FMN transferase [Planctomycetales bacterium]MCB9925213.1 FAD:protein FMN transferase [Planctomycetaceae bacterium]